MADNVVPGFSRAGEPITSKGKRARIVRPATGVDLQPLHGEETASERVETERAEEKVVNEEQENIDEQDEWRAVNKKVDELID